MIFLINTIRVFFNDHPVYPSVSVYFQGCDAIPKCVGCHNPETWDFDEKFAINYDEILSISVEKLSFLLNGFSKVALAFVGGEPLSERNRECVKLLSRDVKKIFGSKVLTILYTWREPIDLLPLKDYIQSIDEFVLGRFEISLKEDGFPASKNQMYLRKEQLEEFFMTFEGGKAYVLEVFK
ncbi:4Fe-4S cluster-binding domain-containing protein [Pseudothermotoga thermarum]|uniref:Uncharacterized protein n=1 Tax=Pseudothermotoga thermarum DSM 5069 TaxID=688269 RepID=F7YV39_9THEM|nr:4Fe-4S cluster-binding domain-containing protein [Pseudothermotoga thermarum]AEH50335.1 hypothetical protein Theth_0235 [Pseudothermotoga thermarum DSM 5069]